jgi:tripartite-type tricarboxylate transporter receptor subunit TctC
VPRVTLSTAALTAALTMGFGLSASLAAADDWPHRTVRVITPFSAGTDSQLRVFAEPLAKRWKQSVVIENRPGAEGVIGVAAFTALRDDHTLLYYSAAPISTFPLTHENLAYDPTRDIVPISSAVDGIVAISATESLGIGSLIELVKLAHAQPGKLNYFPVNGGSFSILLPAFVKSEGLDMVQVNYREASIGIQDLAAGRIHIVMTSLLSSLPLVRSGKIRWLAVTNRQRASIAPDVPTAIEAGYPQLAFEGLQGFFGPRDMPTERRARIAADVTAVAADPTVGDPLASLGYFTRGSTPAEFAAAIEAQRVQMATLAKVIGLKPVP